MGWARAVSWSVGALIATASVWAVAEITSVAPAKGTIGTPFVIGGSGFGAERKPKVALRLQEGEGKPIALFVGRESFSDTQITAIVKRAKAGLYNVVVKPHGREQVEQVSPGTVEIAVGEITSVTPADPRPGEEITINGTLFGPTGTVKVGGKPASIVRREGIKQWSDTQIIAKLHKRTPVGQQALEVKNRIGLAENAPPVNVEEPLTGGGGSPRNDFDARFIVKTPRERARNDRFSPAETAIHVTPMGTGFRLEATASDRGATYNFIIDLSNFDPAGSQREVQPALFEVTQTAPANMAATWRAGPGDVTLRLKVIGDAVVASFKETIPVSSATTEPDLTVDGDFRVALPDR